MAPSEQVVLISSHKAPYNRKVPVRVTVDRTVDETWGIQMPSLRWDSVNVNTLPLFATGETDNTECAATVETTDQLSVRGTLPDAPFDVSGWTCTGARVCVAPTRSCAKRGFAPELAAPPKAINGDATFNGYHNGMQPTGIGHLTLKLDQYNSEHLASSAVTNGPNNGLTARAALDPRHNVALNKPVTVSTPIKWLGEGKREWADAAPAVFGVSTASGTLAYRLSIRLSVAI